MHRREPLLVYETRVDAAWIDDNDHMSDAAYALVFSRAVDALMDRIGLDAAQRKASRRTLYTAQALHRYFAEATAGEALAVNLRLLEHDAAVDRPQRREAARRRLAGGDAFGARRARQGAARPRGAVACGARCDNASRLRPTEY